MRDDAPPLLVMNAKILTLDAQDTRADTLVVMRNRIAAVGRATDVAAAAGESGRRIDAGGRTLIPGLIDMHAHMDREGLKALGPDLSSCRSITDVLDCIASAVASSESGAWIVAQPVGRPPYFWDGPRALREGRLPNRHELDSVAPDNPVYIRPIWGYWRHAPNSEHLVSAANSMALAVSGLSANTQSPSGSVELERDTRGGLTGIFFERTAAPIVELTMLHHASRFTDAMRRDGVRKAMATYNGLATTGIYEGHGLSADVFRAYRAVHAAGDLTVRTRLAHSPAWGCVDGRDPAEIVSLWTYWAAGIGDSMLSLSGLYVDHRTNADDLIRAGASPYTGWAGYHYDSALALPELKRVMIAAAAADIRCVAISSELIETLAEVDAIVPLNGRRWIVQHFGPISAARCETAARLGLVLTTLTGRYIYKEGAKATEHGADYVPLKRLVDAGVPVTFASDNAPPSLFAPIWHAAERRDRDGNDVPPFDQRLSRLEALRCATLHGAYATFEEADRGTIEPGKLADFAILDTDPLTCSDGELQNIRAVLTCVNGRIVHDVLTQQRSMDL